MFVVELKNTKFNFTISSVPNEFVLFVLKLSICIFS